MSGSSDDDIFAYESLSKKKYSKDGSRSSATPSPNPHPPQRKNSSGKGGTKSRKSQKGKGKTKKNAWAKKELLFDGGCRPPKAEGFCPMCQMPLSIVIGSTEQHVARCLADLDNVKFGEECPMGVECDNTIRQHFQRYSHNLLSQKRAGVTSVGRELLAVKNEEQSQAAPSSSPTDSPTDSHLHLEHPGSNMGAHISTDAPSNHLTDGSKAQLSPDSPSVKQNGYHGTLSTPVKSTARKTFPHSPRQFNPEKVVYVLEPRDSEKGQVGGNRKSFSFKKDLLACHSSRETRRETSQKELHSTFTESAEIEPSLGTDDEEETEPEDTTSNLGHKSEGPTGLSTSSAIIVSSGSSLSDRDENSISGDLACGHSKHSEDSTMKTTSGQELGEGVTGHFYHSKSAIPQTHNSEVRSLDAKARKKHGSVKGHQNVDITDTHEGASPPKRSRNNARKTTRGKSYQSIDEVLRAQRHGYTGQRELEEDSLSAMGPTNLQNGLGDGPTENVPVPSCNGGDADSQMDDNDEDQVLFDCVDDLSDEASQPYLCRGNITGVKGQVRGEASTTSSQRSAESPSVFAELDENSKNGEASDSSDIHLFDEIESAAPASLSRLQETLKDSQSSSASVPEVHDCIMPSASLSDPRGTSDLCSSLSKSSWIPSSIGSSASASDPRGTSDISSSSLSTSSWSDIFRDSRGTKFSPAEEVAAAASVEESGFHSSSSSTVRSGSSMWSTKQGRQCPFYKKMPETTFAVDAFSYGDIPGITAYFLTHFHADHYGGLKKTFANPIYCSSITANLVKAKLYVPSKYVHPLAMEKEHFVEGVRVTFMDANHCPGSVLILFHLPNGQRYLHTGDFRAHLKMESYRQLQGCRIQQLYLDTTYLDPKYDFPKQDEVVQYAVDLAVKAVQMNQKTLILCGTYTIGKERVFRAIADALGCKICVESDKKRVLACFDDPRLMAQIVTDKRATRLHVVSMAKLVLKRLSLYLDEFHGLYDNIVAFKPTGWTHSAKSSSLANIKPSTWGGRVKVYGIPYSEHSSYSEMRRFVQFIHSRGRVKIIPTVNVGKPEKRAFMESHFKKWLSEDYRPVPQTLNKSSQGSQPSSTPLSRAQTSTPHSRTKDQPASQEKTLLSFFRPSRVSNL